MKNLWSVLAIGVGVAVLSVAPLRVHAEEASAPKAEKKAASKMMHVQGSVTKVDGANVEVKLPNKETSAFVTDGGTRVMKGNKAASLDDLKAGERVRVLYENTDGKMTAREIHILPPKAGAAHHKGAEKSEKK